jgi:hypothetical protein
MAIATRTLKDTVVETGGGASGGKVTILRKGYMTTNSIVGTPAAGDVAYVDDDGNIGNGSYPASVLASGNLAIGRFLSAKDEDGYAKVEVNLPNHGSN